MEGYSISLPCEHELPDSKVHEDVEIDIYVVSHKPIDSISVVVLYMFQIGTDVICEPYHLDRNYVDNELIENLKTILEPVNNWLVVSNMDQDDCVQDNQERNGNSW